ALAGLERIVGLDFRIEGREKLPPAPVIIAAKHQSAWDTLVYRLAVDNMAPVIKRELVLIPFWGWLVARAGAITIDRAGGPAALKRLIGQARAAKAAGRSIVIFPEGTRVAPGDRRPFLPGVAALYRSLDLPVVPVAVNSGLYWPRRKLFGQRPGTIVLRFLDPIPPGLDRATFMERLEHDINEASDALLAL
ncbi:MAG: lysophospholipid acyltransferase family protein, partial [Alphaproteobacteria bacterium]|nr:lysophospholipid acyltransferase family protein [Alphaproteobacteria bacterium]